MAADGFILLGIAAIVAGGLLMAFSARRPARLTAWASAYLVLVVGVIQVGLAAGWRGLGAPHAALAVVAFGLYNLGNCSVIFGTVHKARTRHAFAIVRLGGGLLALAMILLLAAVRNVPASWGLADFVALAVIILVSMPVGVVLAGRNRQAIAAARPAKSKLPSRT